MRHSLPVEHPSCLRIFGAGCLPARMLRAFFVAAVLLLALCKDVRAQDVLTHHYTNDRLGVQTRETTLTPGNVNYAGFGKVFSFPVLGQVYAQPLYVSQYAMADGTTHNVLFVATQRDYVYAFDADGNNPAQGYLWCVSLLGPAENVVLSGDVGIADITPYIGITGTPVIDRAGGVLYVVAKSKTTGGTTQYIQRLHALRLSDGSEMHGPTTIQATVNGSGEGGATVSFSPLRNNQRPALLLASTPQGTSTSTVFIGWGSHGDNGTYHGWIIGYDASDISKQVGAWADTPNGTQAGIWMSGAGISTDGNGNIFAASGNGSFNANTGGPDYGDCAFRLTLNGSSLTAADYFTPANQSSLNVDDNDMGTGAMLLLPNQSGSIPHLAVTADKSGLIHLLNRDNMGHFSTPNNSSVQSFSDGGYSVHNSLTFFNNTLYLAADGAPMRAWTFNPMTEQFSTTPQSQSAANYGCKGCDGGGSSPSVSANGSANAVLWALDNSGYHGAPAVLHAYDAGNLATELYNSTQAANNRDAPAVAVKFTSPTIANGRVYVGGQNAVSIYGLLSTSGAPAPAPTFSPAAGNYTTPQTVTLSDSIPGASIYYTTNGSTPSTGSTLYQGPVQIPLTATLQAVAIASGYTQSPVTLAEYDINGLPPASQTPAPLASLANTYGIYTDGTKFSTGGMDGSGNAYSAALLEPSITYSGVTYDFLPPNGPDVIRPATAPVLSLPTGSYTALDFLGIAMGGGHANRVFIVTYTDGTTTKLIQNMSDWYKPQHFSGEAIALAMPYRDKSSGLRDNRTFQIYQYSIPLDITRIVASLTLPKDANIAILAVTLITAQTQTQTPPSQVSLAASANTYAMYTDATTFTTGGVDAAGNAYSATLLGSSLTYGGTQFAFLPPNQLNGVSGTNAPAISLPGGAYSTLKFLGLAFNGNQPSQIFTVTYTDGTTSSFTQNMSDWYTPQGYSGEAIAQTTAYRNKGSGVSDNRSFNLYEYALPLNSAKTVSSLTLPNNQRITILAVTLTN